MNSASEHADFGSRPGGQARFLDTLRDGVVVVGPDLRIMFFNASYLAQLGLEPGEIALGAHLEDVARLLAVKGKLGARDGETLDEVVARRMAAWGREEARVERRVLDNGRVLDIYRTPTINSEMVSVHVDVTDSVRAEAEIERQRLYMKVVLDNVSDGVNLLDRDGRFVMFNDRFPQLYGIDPAAVGWGISYTKFAECMGDLANLPEQDRRAEIEARHRFAFDREMTQTRRRLRDGRTLHINKTNLPDGGSVMTLRDITEELRREDELLQARNFAEESARHKADFVARMSHEMRTPLNGILGVAALLEQTRIDERQRELLNVVAASGRVLLRLIDDILDLSRLDARAFEMITDDLDIVGLLGECVGIVEPAAEEKGVDVLLRRPHAPVPPLRGDTVRIKQIVLNLLTNAVKFTTEGHVAIELETAPGPAQVTLSIRVTDTGVGIAADRLERIFDSFYQIDSTVTREYGGAGLGLAITRKLVEAMGGAIHVSSQPGVGSVFRVRLSLPRAEAIRAAS